MIIDTGRWIMSLKETLRQFRLKLGTSVPGARRGRSVKMATGALAVVVVVVLGAATGSSILGKGRRHNDTQISSSAAEYRLARVTRGDIRRFVTAAGRLDAVVTVKVSSQLSGQIAELLVDFNSSVKKGQPLARLDDKTFAAKVTEAEARLANAHAALAQAKAQAAAAEIRYKDAKNDLDRKNRLGRRGVLSDRDMERARAKLAEVHNNLKAAHAQSLARESDVKIAGSLLRQAKIALERTAIRSPIDGIVIKRNVDLGQTVAASLQAPVLFTIAKNLANLEVKIHVDEADIGLVRKGQPVLFRVDAFPGRYFRGKIKSIRKAPRVIQNVTTYTAVAAAQNPGLVLLPGMTATTRIIVLKRSDVLRLPIAALSFEPRQYKHAGKDQSSKSEGVVWRHQNGALTPIRVRIGRRDERYVELTDRRLKKGDQVAIGVKKGN